MSQIAIQRKKEDKEGFFINVILFRTYRSPREVILLLKASVEGFNGKTAEYEGEFPAELTKGYENEAGDIPTGDVIRFSNGTAMVKAGDKEFSFEAKEFSNKLASAIGDNPYDWIDPWRYRNSDESSDNVLYADRKMFIQITDLLDKILK